jgi:hypothetical protein
MLKAIVSPTDRAMELRCCTPGVFPGAHIRRKTEGVCPPQREGFDHG